MDFQRETRTLARAHVGFADTDLIQDMIERLVEQHVVIRHVEMAVVVDPLGADELAGAGDW